MKVVITCNYWWTVSFDVDISPKTAELMKLQIMFFQNENESEFKTDDEIYSTYLKKLAAEIAKMSMDGWNTDGMISEFEKKEGWCKLDGSAGVKLLKADEWEFTEEDFSLEWK